MAIFSRRLSNLIHQLPPLPRIPENIRNGRLKPFFDFWVNYYSDYYAVGRELIQDARNRPVKALAVGSGLLSLVVAFKTNPDEHMFHDQLVSSYVEMGLVDPVIRSPSSYNHVQELSYNANQRVLTRYNLTFFSLMIQNPVNDNCSIYTARCSYLTPSYLDLFRNHILDVGCFNTWWILKHKIVDYDINPDEKFIDS